MPVKQLRARWRFRGNDGNGRQNGGRYLSACILFACLSAIVLLAFAGL